MKKRTSCSWLSMILLWSTANGVVYWELSRQDAGDRRDASVSSDALTMFTGCESLVHSDGGPVACIRHYRLMKPPADDSATRFPVLLFLHGAGQRGTDNVSQLRGLPEQMAQPPWRERFPCFLIAPQCPPGEHWTERLTDLRTVLEEVLKDPRADRDRVYVTGLSMGGYGTWTLAAEHPELFAAAVPICGGGNPAIAERLVGLPLWAVHGTADDIVPVEQSRIMVEAVRAAGGSIQYTELLGVGHDSWTAAYADPEGVVAWMFRQARSRRPSWFDRRSRKSP